MSVAALDGFPLAVDLGLTIQRGGDLLEARTAVLSEDAQYRYVMTIVSDERLPPLVWVMLNPSTADALVDDATIRRCRTFARQWGYGGIVVVNLYAVRSTAPEELWSPRRGWDGAPNVRFVPEDLWCRWRDAIGVHNERFLAAYTSTEVTRGEPVVCAWGAHGRRDGRGAAVARRLEAAGVDLRCLVVTATGQPGHPCRLPGELSLIPLDVAGISSDRMSTGPGGYPYVWTWDESPRPSRKGQRCRVVIRGKAMNSALVEYEDGYQVVTSRSGLRKGPQAGRRTTSRRPVRGARGPITLEER